MRWDYLLPGVVILGLGIRMNSTETGPAPAETRPTMGCFRYVYLLVAGIVVFIGLSAISTQDRSLYLRPVPRMLEDTRGQMSAIAGYLRKYNETNGHYPSNDQGLLVVKPLVKACGGLSYEDSWNSDDRTDPALRWCRVRESGFLTRWGDPFIYENRRGMALSKFADSGATLDTKRHYSVRVDDGIYLWSLGAKGAYEEYSLWRPLLTAATCLVGLVAFGLVALFARDTVISRGRRTGVRARWTDGMGSALAGLLLAVILPAIMLPATMATCYTGGWGSRMRTPELTAQYKALLVKYRDRGIISTSACKKITNAMTNYDDRTSRY